MIVFLDIDGVLNSDPFRRIQDRMGLTGPLDRFDSVNVSHLNALIRFLGADIVVSSAWRYFYPDDELTSILTVVGVVGSIIGHTPRFPGSRRMGVIRSMAERHTEIQGWLDRHPPCRFIILEDLAHLGYLEPHAIRTDPLQGLTLMDVNRAIMKNKSMR